MSNRAEGYYWARSAEDRTTFIVLLEKGCWYVPGVHNPINQTFDESEIIGPVPRLDH